MGNNVLQLSTMNLRRALLKNQPGTALGKGGFFQIVLKDGKVVEVPKISESL